VYEDKALELGDDFSEGEIHVMVDLQNIHNPKMAVDCEADDMVPGMGPSLTAKEDTLCDTRTPNGEGQSSTSASITSTVLERLDTLREGEIFANRYLIGPERDPEHPHNLPAVDIISKEKVVLKFYDSKESFEKSWYSHQHQSSDFVCKLLDVVQQDGFPPCLVFESRLVTLEESILCASTEDITPGGHIEIARVATSLIQMHCCLAEYYLGCSLSAKRSCFVWF